MKFFVFVAVVIFFKLSLIFGQQQKGVMDWMKLDIDGPAKVAQTIQLVFTQVFFDF